MTGLVPRQQVAMVPLVPQAEPQIGERWRHKEQGLVYTVEGFRISGALGSFVTGSIFAVEEQRGVYSWEGCIEDFLFAFEQLA